MIGALIALGMPSYSSYISYARLRSAAWQIMVDLRDLQQKSVIEHVVHQAAFYASDESYAIDGGSRKKLETPIELITFDSQTGDATVSLQKNGTVTDTIPAVASSNIVIRNDKGEQLTIIVAPTTGHVRIQ